MTYKSVSATVTIDTPRKDMKKILDGVRHARTCAIHMMNFNLYAPYNSRPYRRGKNRCKRCGCFLFIEPRLTVAGLRQMERDLKGKKTTPNQKPWDYKKIYGEEPCPK